MSADAAQVFPQSRLTDISRHARTLALSVLRRSARKSQPASMAVIVDDAIGFEVIAHGWYEEELLSLIFDRILTDRRDAFRYEVALDVGANIGNHALYLARRFSVVHAFEPGPIASGLLGLNIRLSNARNVVAHVIGLSDSDAQARMGYVQDGNIGSNAVQYTTDELDDDDDAITLRRGDHFVPPLLDEGARIGLVKIDVEGMEPQVIRGLADILRKHRPVILFELDGAGKPEEAQATIAALREFGYARFETLTKRVLYPQYSNIIVRALLRFVAGSSYRLERRDSFPAFYNMVIARP